MRLAALVGSLILTFAAPAAALERPALSMRSSGQRIIVRGTHFVPNERVTVRVFGRTVSRTRTITTAQGSFRVSLRRPAPRACNTLVVRATGARGDWAVLRIGSPECNPPGAG
jgi:hypothetical protein